jgi:hypothetical protein
LGQYLHMGLCNRIVIGKERMAKLNVSIEIVIKALNSVIDMSLFELGEPEDHYVFTIKESIVLEQLYQFLRVQFSLYNQQDSYKRCFNEVLTAVAEISSLQDVEELVNKKSFPCFQRNVINEEILVNEWYWLKVEYDMWIMFVEGKLFMETYNNFLRFLEKQVRVSSEKWSISGAFRCFID